VTGSGVTALFENTVDGLRQGSEVAESLEALITGLDRSRSSHSAKDWRARVIPALRTHSLYPLLLEDPFVRHSAVRPRGYAGDAELLDFIYGSVNIRPRLDNATPLGRKMYRFTCSTSITQAVRNRLVLSAAEIDRLMTSGSRPEIMCVACGHLREAGMTHCVRDGQFGRFLAVDQDEISLDLVREEWLSAGVEPVQMSAWQLIRADAAQMQSFDFIYALGLYDYLSNEAGARLLRRMVELLKPGGKAWIANFVPGLAGSGFMEAAMDWWLIYRAPSQLEDLVAGVDKSMIASHRLFLEPENNVVFLEIIRA
jgi:extracellular factor (EF) 3-hydroxypalmitic acid methyl ester biosynthesis protein